MQRWEAQSGLGRYIALALLVLASVACVALGISIAQIFAGIPTTWQIDGALFWRVVAFVLLLGLTGALFYRTAAAFTLHYAIDRNGLYIFWLGNRAVIPLDQITRIDPGAATRPLPLGPLQMIGYYWGHTTLMSGERLHLFATRPPARSLIVVTDKGAYAITPADADRFVEDIEQRRNLGATRVVETGIEQSRVLFYEFWNDRAVRGALALGLILNLALLGLITLRYPALAAEIPLRFDAIGDTVALRPRYQILFIPLAALGLLLFNLLVGLAIYRREPFATRVLQVASVCLQILFGVSLVALLG